MLVDRGRHTDIVLAADALTGPAAALRHDFPGATFLVFGFGDRAYLMNHGLSIIQSIEALFPGPGVMLVTGLTASPREAFGDDQIVVLRLSCSRFRMLAGFVQHALATSPSGGLQSLSPGPYPGSAFYATDLTYDLLHDCNRWTAEALRSGGFPVVPEGVIIASQVMSQVAPIAARQKPGPATDCVSGLSVPPAG